MNILDAIQTPANLLLEDETRKFGGRSRRPYPNMEVMPRVVPDGTPPYTVTPGANPYPPRNNNMEQMPIQLPGSPPGLPNVKPWSEPYPNMEVMPIQIPGSPPGLPNVKPWSEPTPNMEDMPRVVPDNTPPYRVSPGRPMPIRTREEPQQYIQPMVQRPDGSWYNPALPENQPTNPQPIAPRTNQVREVINSKVQ